MSRLLVVILLLLILAVAALVPVETVALEAGVDHLLSTLTVRDSGILVVEPFLKTREI